MVGFIEIVLGVVLTGVVGAVGWLVRTVAANERGRLVLEAQVAALKEAEKCGMERVAAEQKVWSEERYVRREDHVPAFSLLASKMDSMAEQLARIEVRS